MNGVINLLGKPNRTFHCKIHSSCVCSFFLILVHFIAVKWFWERKKHSSTKHCSTEGVESRDTKKLSFRTESVALSLSLSLSSTAGRYSTHLHENTQTQRVAQSPRAEAREKFTKKRRRRRRAYTHLYKYTHIIFRTHCNIEGITQIKEVFACLPNHLHRNSDHFAGRVRKNLLVNQKYCEN